MFRAKSAHLQEDTLYTCSIWYCHSLWEFVVATKNSRREWQYWKYHMLHVYNVSSWRWAI